MNAETMPKGFTCGCGTYHEFGVWVAAHWDMVLTHTCTTCGRQHEVHQGKARQIRGPRRTARVKR